MRISELALRVKGALAEANIPTEIDAAYGYTGVRNYRVSGRKIANVLDFRPVVTIEESVANALDQAAGLGDRRAREPAPLQHPLAQVPRGSRGCPRRDRQLVGHPGPSGARRERPQPAHGRLIGA